MKLVLDTNVVVDWLVFDDPFMSPLRVAVRTGRVTIFTHLPALDELRRVLGYRELKLDAARQQGVLERYQAQTAALALPQETPTERAPLPKGFPRCRDRDDDPFVALAWYAKADALVSRDKAVLALARRTRRFGFRILTVQQMIAALQPP